MRSGLAPIALMITLPVIFVSDSHFLLSRLLFLPRDFVHHGRPSVLLLQVEFVVVLCRVVRFVMNGRYERSRKLVTPALKP